MDVHDSAGEDGVGGRDILEDDDLDDADRPPPKRPISRSTGRRRRLPFLLVALVVVGAVAVIALLLNTDSSPSKKVTTNTSGCAAPPAANSPLPAVGGPFTSFQDPVAKFSLSYPAAWKVTKAGDPNVPLLLHLRADDLDTLLVRVVPMQSSVDTSNEAAVKSFTDALISGTGVNVLKQQAIKVNGLVGYYYLYTLPPDPCLPKITLVHSHFFLFPPRELVALVFQTVEPDFAPLAAAFDSVVSSVRATA